MGDELQMMLEVGWRMEGETGVFLRLHKEDGTMMSGRCGFKLTNFFQH